MEKNKKIILAFIGVAVALYVFNLPQEYKLNNPKWRDPISRKKLDETPD